jgi:hypothetical protein
MLARVLERKRPTFRHAANGALVSADDIGGIGPASQWLSMCAPKEVCRANGDSKSNQTENAASIHAFSFGQRFQKTRIGTWRRLSCVGLSTLASTRIRLEFFSARRCWSQVRFAPNKPTSTMIRPESGSGLVSRASPSIRRCAIVREMKEGTSRSANHGRPLQAAAVKKPLGLALQSNLGRRSKTARSREASASEPSMKCRNRILREKLGGWHETA